MVVWDHVITWSHLHRTYDHCCLKSIQMRSFFWSVFFHVRTEYGDLRSKSPYPVRIRENMDQKKLRIWKLFTYTTKLGRILTLRRRYRTQTPKSSLTFCKTLVFFSVLYSTIKSNFDHSLLLDLPQVLPK